MAETMCLSSSVLLKAGANANATIIANGTAMTEFINQAESLINVVTRINYTDTYATLNVDVKKLLEETCSNLAAIYTIQYDMSGYTSLIEAEDMVTILRDGALRGLSLLKDKKQTDFIDGA